MSYLITQGYGGTPSDVLLQGYGIGVAPPPPPPTPTTGAAQGGGFPTGNLVDLVLGKNLKRGKPKEFVSRIGLTLQISCTTSKADPVTILDAPKRLREPNVITGKPRRKKRPEIPIELLLEIDEDIAIVELARRSRQ